MGYDQFFSKIEMGGILSTSDSVLHTHVTINGVSLCSGSFGLIFPCACLRISVSEQSPKLQYSQGCNGLIWRKLYDLDFGIFVMKTRKRRGGGRRESRDDTQLAQDWVGSPGKFLFTFLPWETTPQPSAASTGPAFFKEGDRKGEVVFPKLLIQKFKVLNHHLLYSFVALLTILHSRKDMSFEKIPPLWRYIFTWEKFRPIKKPPLEPLLENRSTKLVYDLNDMIPYMI